MKGARTAVSALFAADGIAFGVWAGHLAAIRSAFDLSPGELAVVLAGVVVGAMTSMPLTGVLARRHSARRLSVVGALISLPALALPGLAPSLGLLAAAAVVFGAGRGVLEVAMNACASDLQERLGRPIFSSFHAAFSLGGMVGAGLASIALALRGNPRVDLPLAALVLTVAVIPAFGALPAARPSPAAARTADAAGRRSFAVLALGGAAFCGLVAEGAAADWSAVYLRGVFATLPYVAPLAYTSFSLAMAMGRIVGDRVQAAVDPAPLLRRCGAAALIAAIGIVAAPNAAVALVGFALFGLALSNVVPILFGTAGRIGGAGAIAAVSTIGYAGFISGPPVIGAIAQFHGLRVGLLTLVVTCVGMLACSALIWRRERAVL